MERDIKDKILNENCDEICETTVIHKDVIDSVKSQMVDNDSMQNLAEFFKILGDSTRIKIILALSKAEMCVCDIAYLLDMSQSAISHQLRVLKQNRFVKNRKAGKVVYYSLLDEHIEDIARQAFIHINE